MQLQYSTYAIQTREHAGKMQVFDPVRKKWVALTPEEWVRQHLIHLFTEDRKFPAGRIAVEKSLRVNGMQRRGDLVLYNRNGAATLLIECKAPEVRLSQEVFDQAARYNLALQVPYLFISNGKEALGAHIQHAEGQYIWLEDWPEFE